jgi:hypothetical protein
VKSLVLLWQRTAAEAAVQCCTSATRDSKRIARRFEHEGIELLTLSLPEIGKAFERSLDQGQVTDDLLSLCGSKAGFPVFLRNFLQLVFERSGGRLLDDPSIDAIQAIRQLTLMFGKILFECKPARVEKAFLDFVECEQELRVSDLRISAEMIADFRRISSMLFGDAFSELDRKVYEGEIIPKHGPGATADRIRGNAKFYPREWTDRLEKIFPAMENLIPNFRYHSSLDKLKYLDPGSERPVRVIAVPKTLKTPRIIAIEPSYMQYMQQGLMTEMVDLLESRRFRFTENPVYQMVGFTDQEPNQLMAQKGSSDGSLATLDLSEASDRVSLRLVSAITDSYPHLFEAVMATRSYRADVPGHGVIPLAKFASMGSALTFPMEECVFLTTIFYGIEQELGRRLTLEDVKSYQGKVRVYGDDLIVPVDIVLRVVESLELFGFKVNRNKSYWTGRFRESCGREYYDGHEVSIFRVRRTLPSHRADVPGVVSTVALRNQAYWQGYWGVARYLDQLLEVLIPLPNVSSSSRCLGRESALGYSEERTHPTLHHPLVRGMAIRTRIPSSKVENEFALLKCLLKRGDEPYADVRHLERQGRPEAVGIKLGWHRPY